MEKGKHTELYKFQKDVIKEINLQFSKGNVVNLEGASLSGKTTIIEHFELKDYEKHIITGSIEYKSEDLGAFKNSNLYGLSRKVSEPIKSVGMIITSFLGNDSAFLEGFNGLYQFFKSPDVSYLIKRFKKKKKLVIIDNVELLDQKSISFIEYLMDCSSLDNEQFSIKLVVVTNASSKSFNFNNSTYPIVKVGDITGEDSFKLGIGEDPEAYRGVPIEIVRKFASDSDEKSIQTFIEKDFRKK